MMGERIARGSLFHFPPSPSGGALASPHRSSSLSVDRERYLTELLAERQKLGPFMQVLPHCTKLLYQEIRRISGFRQTFVDHEGPELDSPFRSYGQFPNGRSMHMEGWPAVQMERKIDVAHKNITMPENGHINRMVPLQSPPVGWPAVQGIPTTPNVKKVVRLDVPVDKYPSYNFVGRILGPRGNSLKRVEAMTECRVYIRGWGSVKDSVKDESLDHYKKQQLRELALLNGTLREESPSMGPSMSPSMSPFNTTGMKRAKTLLLNSNLFNLVEFI